MTDASNTRKNGTLADAIERALISVLVTAAAVVALPFLAAVGSFFSR